MTGDARLREALEGMLHDVASAIGRLRLATPTTADDDQRRDMELIVAACKRAREALAAVPEAPEPVYEWRVGLDTFNDRAAAEAMIGHFANTLERRTPAVAPGPWERVEEGTER